MTIKHAIAGACAIAMLLVGSPSVAKAEEQGKNYALEATARQMIPEEYQSDTLSAVNDGLRFPDRPWNGNGANPYAWTNYGSVQSKYTPGCGLWLDLAEPVTVDTVVIYQFVDSYSADLPQTVAFYLSLEGQMSTTPAFELVSTEKVSSTCYKMTYDFTGDVSERTASTFQLYELEQFGRGSKVVDRCVGIYEIEIYGQGHNNPYPHEDYDPKPSVVDFNMMNLSSDTLGAVIDGVLYPQTPWAGGGPNPYAWTNYDSAQQGFKWSSIELSWNTNVMGQQQAATKMMSQVTLYHFVDSYSADLPAEVRFYMAGNKYDPYDTELYEVGYHIASEEWVSDTCVKRVYQFIPWEAHTLRISLAAQEGVGGKVVERCVGLYEIVVE